MYQVSRKSTQSGFRWMPCFACSLQISICCGSAIRTGTSSKSVMSRRDSRLKSLLSLYPKTEVSTTGEKLWCGDGLRGSRQRATLSWSQKEACCSLSASPWSSAFGHSSHAWVMLCHLHLLALALRGPSSKPCTSIPAQYRASSFFYSHSEWNTLITGLKEPNPLSKDSSIFPFIDCYLILRKV